jgi:uncharacterized membrane protein
MGHAHGHGSGWDEGWDDPVAARMRTALSGVVAVIVVATLIGLAVWWPRGEMRVDREQLGFGERVAATVDETHLAPCSHDPSVECNTITFTVNGGDAEGTTTSLEFEIGTQTTASKLRAGDKFVLNDAGPDLPTEARFSYADMQRRTSLWLLVLVFAAAVIALGRFKGLLALIGIVITGGVLLTYVFPALLRGVSPLGVALTASSVIAFATLYLAHGFNQRTTIALLGTMTSLLLIVALATVFSALAELSGLASEESVSLLAFAPDLDFRGLLLAAVIIGALGVLDDVTVTQVSAVWELRRSSPEASAHQLYSSGIRIGRDHIASTVNTLVLAYSAAALPLLLLFTQSGLALGDVLTTETIAVEIVQTLVGSIGLVASVPLTTALACLVATRGHPTTVEPAPPTQSPAHWATEPGPSPTEDPSFWGSRPPFAQPPPPRPERPGAGPDRTGW